MPSNTLLFLSRTVRPFYVLGSGNGMLVQQYVAESQQHRGSSPGACLPSSLYRLHQDVHLKVNRKKGTHAVLADTTTAPPTMFFLFSRS
jgi:hypothetical protein|uniref:Uncharacterized protein n=1 Tax=Zea mays TaxID=4577 RepID=C0HFU2_MAIZE|nr:unknown [Zea mays]